MGEPLIVALGTKGAFSKSVASRLAKRFLDLEVERVGSAKVENSRIEKGLEQCMEGAGFFSMISKMITGGRDITGVLNWKLAIELGPGG